MTNPLALRPALLGLLLVGSLSSSPAATGAGDLDPAFGTAGKVVTGLAEGQRGGLHALVLLPDGKILAAGYISRTFEPQRKSALVVRYLADGTLDPGFGQDGIVIVGWPDLLDEIYGLAVSPDSRIVVAGIRYPTTGSPPADPDFLVMRFEPDGDPDATFGDTGTLTTDFGQGAEGAQAVAVQADGKIVVAGIAGLHLALARYLPDGSLDASFDGDGRLTTDTGGFEHAHGIMVQPDGRLVAAGSRRPGAGTPDWDFFVARYSPDGSPDTQFGTGGFMQTDFTRPSSPSPSYDYSYASLLAPNGDLVLGGIVNDGTHDDDFGLMRSTSGGWLDATFGDGGTVITDYSFVPGAGDLEALNGLARGHNGTLVAGGYVGSSFSHMRFLVARYDCQGSPDASFGNGGWVETDFQLPTSGGAVAGVSAVAVQGDGKIVAAGSAGSLPALARYLASGGDELFTDDFERCGLGRWSALTVGG